MSVTIPSLDPVTDILDTDKIMVTQSSGQTYTIDGASFNKRNQAVIASSTTLTGAPLKTGNIVRAYFTADITGVNTTTGLVLNYNGSNKNVKVPKDGALANFTAQNMGGSPTVYKYLQAYTTLELLYDGTNFVIIGNPVVISSSNYTIYADGKKELSENNIDNNFQKIQTEVVSANSSYTTSIFANTGIPSSANSGLYKLQRQKAYIIILSALTDVGDNTGYILGVLRIGRNGGNVTFNKISENGVSSALQRLNLVTFSAGTGDDDTVIINNGSNIPIMINTVV